MILFMIFMNFTVFGIFRVLLYRPLFTVPATALLYRLLTLTLTLTLTRTRTVVTVTHQGLHRAQYPLPRVPTHHASPGWPHR